MIRAMAAALLSVAPLLSAAAEPIAAVAGERGVYVFWGPSPAKLHVVQRSEGGGPFREVARVEPAADRARGEAILRASGDELAKALELPDDFPRGAVESPSRDLGLALASPGWARARGAAWLDESVKKSGPHRYRVIRVGVDGAETILGEAEAIAGRPAGPPAPSVMASAGKERPALSWFTSPFVSYHVLRATSSDGPFARATALRLAGGAFADSIAWQDEAAPADGATLFYRVVPHDLLGQPGAPSKTVSVKTPDRTPPAPPSGLSTRGIPGGLALEWTRSPEADAAGYHLYRTELARVPGKDEVAAGERRRITTALLPAGTTRLEDRGATPGKVFRYEITASDRSGNESSPSPPALGAPKDETPPAAPSGLRAEAKEDGRVRLSWAAGSERDLWAYRVHHAMGEKGEPRLLHTVERSEPGGTVEHEVSLDPRSQSLHRFSVSAVDRTENEGPRSAEVRVRLPDRVPPGVPIVTGLAVSDGAVEVAFAAPANEDLSGFHVYRQTGGPPLERITEKPLPATARSHRDFTARPGAALAYAVSAVDRSGNEGPRSEARSTVAFRTLRLPPPEGLSVRRVAPGRAAVEWRPAVGARGTMVYRAAEREGTYRQVGDLATGDGLAVDPPGEGSAWFRARSVGPGGELSELSAPVELRAAPERRTP